MEGRDLWVSELVEWVRCWSEWKRLIEWLVIFWRGRIVLRVPPHRLGLNIAAAVCLVRRTLYKLNWLLTIWDRRRSKPSVLLLLLLTRITFSFKCLYLFLPYLSFALPFFFTFPLSLCAAVHSFYYSLFSCMWSSFYIFYMTCNLDLQSYFHYFCFLNLVDCF